MSEELDQQLDKILEDWFFRFTGESCVKGFQNVEFWLEFQDSLFDDLKPTLIEFMQERGWYR